MLEAMASHHHTPETRFFILAQQQILLNPPCSKNPVKDFCWWDLGGVCL
jgi:hypothetical protein